MRSKEELIEYIGAGHKVKYLMFWGHQKPKDGSVNKSCFSQWYEVGFESEGNWYKTAEHFMMAEKAKLFDSEDMVTKIISSKHPREAKRLGRQVQGFDPEIWDQEKFSIVERANYCKFSQNELLKDFLLSTENRVLVEASPVDAIWGIGLESSDPRAEDPKQWFGENLLGFALMEVRKQLSV
ncbi:NADAR family protein [Litoribrevibacter euphylliae]|uniref:NADAR family protein n=1 Tax=Litoribrevibacter euphylliae TaxID=1834034 RepID=A0ABV7HFW4_9GAMM